jgi:hypothetical protein
MNKRHTGKKIGRSFRVGPWISFGFVIRKIPMYDSLKSKI